MKTFTNANAQDLTEAVDLARRARQEGRTVAVSGGGSDLLGMVKERLITPDVVVNLRTAQGPDRDVSRIQTVDDGVRIGGLITLEALSQEPLIRDEFTVLAEAAGGVATPQIRHVGTLAGNVCQRPWCWYYRNGFPCYKAGGTQCFSYGGENQFHAIFGGGPSYIVHPSDTAAALVALDATFRLVGAAGERLVSAADFFVLPRRNAARENVLEEDEIVTGVDLPTLATGSRSAYHKVMDRESWTHAIVSAAVVLTFDTRDETVCRRARIVLGGVAPIPWRVSDAERMLEGQRVTQELAARAADAAMVTAQPLSGNGYKVPLVKGVIERTISDLVGLA